jgi:hypothetical protein
VRDPRYLRDPRQIGPVVVLDQSDMVERLEFEFGNFAFGADDDVGILVRPHRSPFVRDVGNQQQERMQRLLFFAQLAFQLRRLRPRLLGLFSELGLFLAARVLETAADGIALRAQLVDLRLERSHLRIERQERIHVQVNGFRLGGALHGLAIVADEVHSQHRRLPSGSDGAGKPP